MKAMTTVIANGGDGRQKNVVGGEARTEFTQP